MRTVLSSTFIALFLAIGTGLPSAAQQPLRPNILVFYVDDMGWGSIGPNGQTERRLRGLPYVRTPNLDRLAAEGINFTRGYGCHVCSPARSSLQTGFHQGHTYADRNDPDNARKAIRKEDLSIGTVLSEAGYATGYWGKWGYGGSKDQANPVIQNVQTLPTSHGFQSVLAELHHVRAHTFFQPTLWRAPAANASASGMELVANSLARYRDDDTFPPRPALQNHSDYPDVAYCDDSYAFAALEFVRRQAQQYNRSGQPFLGILAGQIPHAPFGEIETLPDWEGIYAGDASFKTVAGQTRQWAAMVTRIDAHFGNILAALEDPNHDGDRSDSVADNTLVVFLSDNGGPRGKNNVELDANGGLSGTKGTIREGGIRVPFLLRWPSAITESSKLRAGTDSDLVIDVTDLLPTFAELAGATVPLGIDGVSLAPTLTGSGHQRRREFLIHEANSGKSIIRQNYKLVQSKDGASQLYQLSEDPAEQDDIASEHPKLVRELESLLVGERVHEPKGFANTYHHWTGGDRAATSDSDNWSDYTYSNAGVTYMTDDGSPRPSWIARIENSGAQARTAVVDRDLSVLALQISGNPETQARQTLTVGPAVELTGRNEIRIAKQGCLALSGGSVSSLRWVDIAPGALLTGSGKVNAVVYNTGTVAVEGDDSANLEITGDYHQSDQAELRLSAVSGTGEALGVRGTAILDGRLTLSATGSSTRASQKPIVVLTADKLSGKFSNDADEVIAPNGTRFAIGYTATSVTLTLKQ